jgi:glutamate dehydrogenase
MSHAKRKRELLDAVVERVHARVPAPHTAAMAAFVETFYARIDAADLIDRSVDELYGAALSLWHLMQERDAGTATLRVYNPTVPEHGWQSKHTIVEMVNDDMPFLVDSVTTELNRHGLALHMIVHPVVRVQRDAAGTQQTISANYSVGDGQLESLIQAEVDRRSDPAALAALSEGLARVLNDVRVVVSDWQPMLGRLRECIGESRHYPGPQNGEQSAEESAFLEWLADGNFTLLGSRNYELGSAADDDVLRIVPESGLGILRGGGEVSGSFANLSPELRARIREPKLLILAKSNARSTVHRPGYLDYIGIRRFDAAGAVIGEHCFLGLFTSSAYNANPSSIPLLRHKLRSVVTRAGFMPSGHGAKALQSILEQYPRDELIQAELDDLYPTAMGILSLDQRQRTRVFVRRDVYGRFFSCIVFVPRERYDTDQRLRIQRILMTTFGGVSCEHSVQISESMLARVVFVIRVRGTDSPDYDVADLERCIDEATRRWEDGLAIALDQHLGEEPAMRLLARYRTAFPAAYREAIHPGTAIYDIDLMEKAAQDQGRAINLYVPLEVAEDTLRVKILNAGAPLALSDSMPMLEHMGLRVIDEQPYRIDRRDGGPVWIHDFGLTHATARRLPVERLRTLFHEAFLQIWRGVVENDNFNQLVLAAGLDWRQVKVLRAYAKYMRQAGVSFSQRYIENTLIAQPKISTLLISLFETRFAPALAGDRASAAQQIETEIEATLETVANLDDDRILRQFLALIRATLRTNFFRRDGAPDPKQYLSFKFNPADIPGLPEPRPKFEIFVFSPRVEGVHLRGGYVARGGLRWSDRMEDYRTEVLGLVKAQRVKNAVIVPTGSKGGFVVKRPSSGGDREAVLKEGIACYETYLQGLLDLTDNLVNGKVVPPVDVIRYDGDDPYLVVAADKGTASFSDTANAVARRYGFWLDDAFASGGSVGYDHKKMGITARGAWESIKRHFRELGRDIQTSDFSVVGIGDMSGDVFGNGMLLSPHIRLIAAFDHRHIFLDPTPDPALSHTERQRLFALPRSSWADYDAMLISSGGGIWPRSAKSIALSPQVRQSLDIDAEMLTPGELISAILRAPVDLLYNGGIGTYVKAVEEANAQVGDRANDGIRINGRDLRCKVVGEGGNLGFTQRGRIEFAHAGGRIYTDAIDNSAGVDCSDHEVNIKILLNAVVADGELTGKQRDKLLADMTSDVAALVLNDNLQQTQILSLMAASASPLFDDQVRYMRKLEKAGKLNRALEYLPDDEEVAKRRTARNGMTLPELSVLLAYSKIDLYEQIIASAAPEHAVVASLLQSYFPLPLRTTYADAIAAHPLRREIIATCAVNEMINRVGSTFAFMLAEETGAEPGQILCAYTVARDAFGLNSLWAAIDTLDPSVPAATQNALFMAIAGLVARVAQWLLRRPAYLRDLGLTIDQFAAAVSTLDGSLDHVLKAGEQLAFSAAIAGHVEAGVPPDLARRVVSLVPLFAALDIAEIVSTTAQPAENVALAYFELVNRLELLWLNQQIATLPVETHWQGLARDALRDDLAGVVADLTAGVFRHGNAGAVSACPTVVFLQDWEASRQPQLKRYVQVLGELKSGEALDMPMVSVVLRELKALARA